MLVLHSLPERPLSQPTALTIGNFDGVHLGHQALLRHMIVDAHRHGWQAGLLTFDPHPVDVLRPQVVFQYLTTVPERLAAVGELGLDLAVVYPFTLETARTPASRFIEQLNDSLNLAALWVGPDFALGRDRQGDVATLSALGKALGFQLRVIEPQLLAGEEVRSGRIRQHLLEGEVVQAAQKLGRRYRVSGVVTEGARRGRTIGFPTANLNLPERRLLPANGVYATWAEVLGNDGAPSTLIASVTNIGVRPSFDNGERTVETHLLDYQGDLYGQSIALEFVERLRPEARFASVTALRAQIQADVDRARLVLASIAGAEERG